MLRDPEQVRKDQGLQVEESLRKAAEQQRKKSPEQRAQDAYEITQSTLEFQAGRQRGVIRPRGKLRRYP